MWGRRLREAGVPSAAGAGPRVSGPGGGGGDALPGGSGGGRRSPAALAVRSGAPCPERPRGGRVPRPWALVAARWVRGSWAPRLPPASEAGAPEVSSRRAPADKLPSPTPRPKGWGFRTPRSRRRRGDPETFLSAVRAKAGWAGSGGGGWSGLRVHAGTRGAQVGPETAPPSGAPYRSRGHAGSGLWVPSLRTSGAGRVELRPALLEPLEGVLQDPPPPVLSLCRCRARGIDLLTAINRRQ